MSNLAQELSKLSSAEDFLTYFGVPFDESVLNRSRLHILQRFYQYMRKEKTLELDDDTEMYRQMRELLAKSYDDFVRSTPAQEKVFKVLQEADGKRVPISMLKDSLKRNMSA